jgi:hypothetical protein
MDGERPDRGPRWIPVAAFVVAAALGAAFFLHVRFFNDDSLITIRYAENLARGNGLVYNAGEKVLGTTTPLWALLLAGVAKIGVDPVAAATWIGVLAFGWTAAATTLVFRNRGARTAAQILAAALVATSPVLLTWAGAGMETSLYVASLATFVWLFESQRWRALGFVGGAMVLIRPDAGLVLMAAAVVEKMRSRAPLFGTFVRVLPGFAVVVVPWIVGAWLYYGSPLPNSGFAKRMQVEDWGTYGAALGRALWAVGPLLAFAFVGFAASAMSKTKGLPGFALVVVVFGMHFGGLPGCGWYLAAPMYLVVLLAADGASLVWSALLASPATLPFSAAALAAPLIGHVCLPGVAHDLKISQAQIERCHGRVGAWLHDHAPAGASVGVDNIGYIGYRSGLRVVDMLGLVQPETSAAIGRGERDYALRHDKPELVAMWVGRGNTWKYAPDAKWFADNGYKVVFEAPLYDERSKPAYTVFSRVEIRL